MPKKNSEEFNVITNETKKTEAQLVKGTDNLEAVVKEGTMMNILKTNSLKLGEIPETVNTEAQVISTIYYQLNKLFGGSQLFTMEYPSRGLNQLDYAYKLEDYTSSSLTKPYVIAENEFRLSDNLMDLAPIVQSPNGKSLATEYDTLLNNYAPKLTDITEYVTDKLELRLFLMEKITDTIGDKEYTCSRMEFCQKLYLHYLEARNNWNQEKFTKNREANQNNTLDEYAEWLATTAWTKDQELEALFHDAIIRGFYHEIMTILGFIDVASPAERLENAKANKRISVRRRIDGSGEVLPVTLQPTNWFRALSPNFSPKDLTLDEDYLTELYHQKVKLLEALRAELRVITTEKMSTKSLDELTKRVEDLKSQLVIAEQQYYEKYTSAAVNIIKLAFEVISNGDMVGFLANNTIDSVTKMIDIPKLKKIMGISDDASSDDLIKTLIGEMFSLYQSHLDYYKTYEELLEAELIVAKNMTKNHDERIAILTERIELLSAEVEKLATILSSGLTDKSQNNDQDKSLFPNSKYDEENLFSELVFNASSYQKMKDEMQNSTVGDLSASIGNFLFNSSASVNVQSSDSAFLQELVSSNFEIGMRVMKVTIERGKWFDPGIVDISSSFMRIRKNLKASDGESAASFLKNYDPLSPIRNTSVTGEQLLLPAYPMAFIIAKDIYIKADGLKSSEEIYKSFRKETANSSTNIFGIRISGGVTSESYMSYAKASGDNYNFMLKIPGPQILGWFMEITPEDLATEYVPLSGDGQTSSYFDKIIDSMKEYRKKINELEHIDEFDNNNDCIVTTVRLPKKGSDETDG